MAIGVKNAAVIDKGGNVLINVLLTTTTASPGFAVPTITNSNTYNLGQINNSTVAQTANKSSFKNEAGDTVTSSYEYELVTTGVLMQTDKDLIDYLADTVKGRDVLQIKYLGQVNGSDSWAFQVGSVTPQFAVARPGGTASMPYEHTATDLTAAFEISAANMAAIASTLTLSTTSYFPTVTVTISASKNYEIVEVA